TPAGTSRGFGIAEFQEVGELIVEVLEALSQKGIEEDALTEAAVREKVKKLVGRFPIYNGECCSGVIARGTHQYAPNPVADSCDCWTPAFAGMTSWPSRGMR